MRLFSKVILTICCIILAGSFIIGILFTQVPDIEGMTTYEAKQLLYESDLKIKLPLNTNDNDSSIIIWQSVGQNDLVLRGTTVGVMTNEIPQTIGVPYMIGEKYENAIALLIENGLQYRIRVAEENSTSLDQYYVSYQSIAAGSIVPAGTVIDLELSLHEIETPLNQETSIFIPVPKLIGLEEQEAVDLLMSLGLEGSVYWLQGTDENADQYYIFNQSIPEGTLVVLGTIIELEHTPKQFESPAVVPYVIGMDQDSAVNMIRANGLQFQVWWTEEENSKMPVDIYSIKGQSISAGSTVPVGTIIELELTTEKPNT